MQSSYQTAEKQVNNQTNYNKEKSSSHGYSNTPKINIPKNHPEYLLNTIYKKYPKIRYTLRDIRANRNMDLKPWNNYCYMSDQGWGKLEKHFKRFNTANLPLNVIATILTWETSKSIYEFKPRLLQQLTTTHTPIDLSSKHLYRLPQYSCYIPTPNNYICDKQVNGFFLWLSQDADQGESGLNFTFDTYNGFLCTLTLPLSHNKSIKECLDAIDMDNYQWLTQVNILSKTALLTALLPYLNIALYLCTENAQFSSIYFSGKPKRPNIIRHPSVQNTRQIVMATNTVYWKLGSHLADYGTTGFADFKVIEKHNENGKVYFQLYWNGV